MDVVGKSWKSYLYNQVGCGLLKALLQITFSSFRTHHLIIDMLGLIDLTIFSRLDKFSFHLFYLCRWVSLEFRQPSNPRLSFTPRLSRSARVFTCLSRHWPTPLTHAHSVQWSFGVLLWELMTRCLTPYNDQASHEIIVFLKSGNRLRQPKYCPETMLVRPSTYFDFIHQSTRVPEE